MDINEPTITKREYFKYKFKKLFLQTSFNTKNK